jgi:hypothetical protein
MTVHPPSIPRLSPVLTPCLSIPLPPLRGEGEDGPAWTDDPRVKKIENFRPIGVLIVGVVEKCAAAYKARQPPALAAE